MGALGKGTVAYNFNARRQAHIALEQIGEMQGVARMLRKQLVAMLPQGCLTWVHLRTDISRLIAESWMDVATSIDKGDDTAYAAALNQCVTVYLRVAKVYQAETRALRGAA